MASDPNAALTAAEAFGALAPLIGGAGLSGIIVAIFGYLKAARDGRKATLDPPAQMALATLFTDRAALQEVAQGANRLAASLEGLSHVISSIDGSRFEKLVDELRDLRRTVEDAAQRERNRN